MRRYDEGGGSGGMMRTPICDFAREYAEKDGVRYHMPGHKGVSFIGVEKYDLTEIDGADVLYSPEGIILESEDNASRLFGSAHSFYSTEGSTLCIKAMLMLATLGRKGRATVLAARNAHKAFVSAAALLDIDVEWIYPDETESLCSCRVSAERAREAINALPHKPAALYITSPDYLGAVADVRGIADVCHEAGIPLLVDNAHGAYLHFLKEPCHPLDLGADICCDSAHKTLSALTGGAYLHISKNADREYLLHAREALSLFASSSPSYLILESLDACNAYLDGKYKDELSMASERVLRLRETIETMGIPVYHGEPLKLVIKAAEIGYSGVELGAHLRKNGIEIEFCDVDFAVLMMTPQNSERDGERLIAALRKLEIKKPIERASLRILPAQRAMSIREATFCRREKIKVADAAQRVCADSCLSCPPCVPVAVSGELITSDTVELLKYYGIDEISVVI